MDMLIKMLLSLPFLASVGSTLALKSITYDGAECSLEHYRLPYSHAGIAPTLDPSGRAARMISCPVAIKHRGDYTYGKLGYAIIEGTHLLNPRLCRRASTGTVSCGGNTALGATATLLHKAEGGSESDQVFLSVAVNSDIGRIRHYTVVWTP